MFVIVLFLFAISSSHSQSIPFDNSPDKYNPFYNPFTGELRSPSSNPSATTTFTSFTNSGQSQPAQAVNQVYNQQGFLNPSPQPAPFLQPQASNPQSIEPYLSNNQNFPPGNPQYFPAQQSVNSPLPQLSAIPQIPPAPVPAPVPVSAPVSASAPVSHPSTYNPSVYSQPASIPASAPAPAPAPAPDSSASSSYNFAQLEAAYKQAAASPLFPTQFFSNQVAASRAYSPPPPPPPPPSPAAPVAATAYPNPVYSNSEVPNELSSYPPSQNSLYSNPQLAQPTYPNLANPTVPQALPAAASQPVPSAQAKPYAQASVHYVNIDEALNGNYKFGYQTGAPGSKDNSFREETRLPDGTVKGAYGYIDANGQQTIIKYTAGKHGFTIDNDSKDGQTLTAATQSASPSSLLSSPNYLNYQSQPSSTAIANYGQARSVNEQFPALMSFLGKQS